MSRIQDVLRELEQVATIVNLTGAFEGLASLQISKVKDQVLSSKAFFNELWQIYTQLRVDATFHLGRGYKTQAPINKELLIAITAEGGFSGDIDEKLIKWMLENYDPAKQDIVVIGHHGAVQLSQRGVSIREYFKLPEKEINIGPVVALIGEYKSATAYYQTYVSLSVQDIKRLSLQTAVQEQGKQVKGKAEEISEANYIFEPSTFEVVGHLERSMINIMLGQIILESRLAQYASRFRAMSAAHQRAKESRHGLNRAYNSSKRAFKDERIREIINGMKNANA